MKQRTGTKTLAYVTLGFAALLIAGGIGYSLYTPAFASSAPALYATIAPTTSAKVLAETITTVSPTLSPIPTPTPHPLVRPTPVVVVDPTPTPVLTPIPTPVADIAPPTPHILFVENISASTNTSAGTFTVFTDGGATLVYQESTSATGMHFSDKMVSPGTLNLSQVKQDLYQIGDVSTIKAGMCGKSVSFGTTDTVTYKNNTSGDLSCSATEQGKELYQAISVLLQIVQNS